MGSFFVSLRLPLDKISCTRQFESKLSLRSFAKSLAKGRVFRKPTRPSLPLRKAPPFSPSLSFLRNERMYPPSGARNRFAIRLADHQRSRHVVRAGTALFFIKYKAYPELYFELNRVLFLVTNSLLARISKWTLLTNIIFILVTFPKKSYTLHI